jgi:hypothetical protein
MQSSYPVLDEPATPDYVLAVLRDWHRQASAVDEADGEVNLSFETSVDEWRWAYLADIFNWREWAQGQNQLWGIECPDAEWREVLTPPRLKRLHGVCELIARYARRPRIRPACLFGKTCETAGAFLTIRSLLDEAGADAEKIAPSTPLASYTRRYPGVFAWEVSRLSPGVMPPLRVQGPWLKDFGGYGLAMPLALLPLAAAAYLLGLMLPCQLLVAGSGLGFLVWMLMAWFGHCYLLPRSVEIGDLRTFRDLARVLVRGGSDQE